MKNLMNFNEVNSKIIVIRNQNVILDSDVATLYGVQTRDINKSVKNNPGKFPEGYVFDLETNEKQEVVENFHHLEKLRFSPNLPKAFTEKGLYMLATILKSPQAEKTTIEIVEAFAKLRTVSSNLADLNSMEYIETIEPEIIEHTGNLLNELLFSRLPTAAETSVEVNLGLVKLKRLVKSEKPAHHSELEEMKQIMKQIQEQLKAPK